jgi:hypothetical protein
MSELELALDEVVLEEVGRLEDVAQGGSLLLFEGNEILKGQFP